MGEITKHTGSCHCGKVRYEVSLDLSAPVTSCNCSMCGRAGTLLTFVPATQFTLLSGEGDLKDYLFNKHHIHHLFCTSCGIKSFARGKSPRTGEELIAVNARCLEDVDVSQLNVKQVDGKKY